MTVRSFLFCIREKDLAAKCLSSAEEVRYTYNKMNLEPCQKIFSVLQQMLGASCI